MKKAHRVAVRSCKPEFTVELRSFRGLGLNHYRARADDIRAFQDMFKRVSNQKPADTTATISLLNREPSDAHHGNWMTRKAA